MKFVIGLSIALFAPVIVSADVYSCAKMVYKDGWLRKYDNLGNTWGANTKKHGAVSSSVGSSVERTTSSADPGVTTGRFMSVAQYSSSWGECSILEMNITRQFRQDYIEQNLGEIKKQVAMGSGHHVDGLAFASGCSNLDSATWSKSLQGRTADFYDSASGLAFANLLDNVISGDDSLKSNCRVL